MRAPDGRARPLYADFAQLSTASRSRSLVTKQIAAEELFRRLGVTFAVYADGGWTNRGRLIPFDLIPRFLDRADGSLSNAAAFSGEGDRNIFL